MALLAREERDEKKAVHHLRLFSEYWNLRHLAKNEDTSLWEDYIMARIKLQSAIKKIEYPFYYALLQSKFMHSMIDNGIFDRFAKDYLNKSAENHFDNWHSVCSFISAELKSFTQNKSEKYNPKNDQDDFTGIIEFSIERYNQYKDTKEIVVANYDLYAWVNAINVVEKQIKGYEYSQVNDQDSNIISILKNIFFAEKESDIKIKAILESLQQKYLQSENSINFRDWYKICPTINQDYTAIDLDQSEIINNPMDNDGLSDKIALDNQLESDVVTDL